MGGWLGGCEGAADGEVAGIRGDHQIQKESMRAAVQAIDQAAKATTLACGGPAKAVTIELRAPIVGAGRVSKGFRMEACKFRAIERAAPGISEEPGRLGYSAASRSRTPAVEARFFGALGASTTSGEEPLSNGAR